MDKFVCGRCCRPLSQKTPFFMTNCYHLMCAPCVKHCIVNTHADSHGLYSVTCPVEEKIRKIMPLQKLPPEGRGLFKDIKKVATRLNYSSNNNNYRVIKII